MADSKEFTGVILVADLSGYSALSEKGSGISKYALILDRAVGIQSVWHESRAFILQEPSITLFPGVIGDR
jgi:hypothetical protein